MPAVGVRGKSAVGIRETGYGFSDVGGDAVDSTEDLKVRAEDVDEEDFVGVEGRLEGSTGRSGGVPLGDLFVLGRGTPLEGVEVPLDVGARVVIDGADGLAELLALRQPLLIGALIDRRL